MTPGRLFLSLCLLSCAVLNTGCTDKKKARVVPAAQPVAPVPSQTSGIDSVFNAGQVELPKQLKGIEFGTDMANLEAIAKPLAQGKTWQPSATSDISYRPIFHTDNKTLRYLEVTLPQGSLGALEKLWGLPENVNIDGRERRQVWLDSNKTIQAIFKLEEKTDKVVFWPITNLNQLLSLEQKENDPVPLARQLGQQTQAAESAYPRRLNRPGGFAAWLAPLPYRTRPVTVFFDEKEGRIQSISMRIDGDQTGQFEQALVQHINRQWGAPKKTSGKARIWNSTAAMAVELRLRKEEASSDRPRPPRFHLSLKAAPAPSAPAP